MLPWQTEVNTQFAKRLVSFPGAGFLADFAKLHFFPSQVCFIREQSPNAWTGHVKETTSDNVNAGCYTKPQQEASAGI